MAHVGRQETKYSGLDPFDGLTMMMDYIFFYTGSEDMIYKIYIYIQVCMHMIS